MREKIISYLEACRDVFERALDMFKLGQGSVDELRKKLEKLKNTFEEIYNEALSAGGEEAVEYIPILDSIQGITYSIEGIIYSLGELAKERIPLSDKAVREVEELKASVSELIGDISDLIKVRNKTLAEALAEKAKAVSKRADAFSLEHEERVISGVCTPKASPIYLNLLSSIKGISYSTYKIAKKVLMS